MGFLFDHIQKSIIGNQISDQQTKKQDIPENNNIFDPNKRMNIFLFHRDLRLIDNTALIAQLKTFKQKVVPAFIFTPEQIKPEINRYFSSNSVQFMVESLQDLNKQVSQYDGKIYYFYGNNLQVLSSIHSVTKINSIAFNLDYTPYAKKRDEEIINWAKQNHIQVVSKEDYCLYNLMDLEFTGKNNTPPTFTPFKFYCYDKLQVRKPDDFNKFEFLTCDELNNLEVSCDFQSFSKTLYQENKNLAVRGGRQNSVKIANNLKQFTNYFNDRSFPALPATKLSAYLHFTTISLRQVYHKVVEILGKNSHLIFELHCREYFTYIIHRYPKMLQQDNNKCLYSEFNNLKWNTNQEWLQKWKQGTTGVPFVDAGIREMNSTGYMHNRTRQNVACFLVKDLLIDWKEGQKYFAQKLADYSPTQNAGNWQYVAGVGTDPREVRIFNPWIQAKKYDPDCVYIKRWIPQLQDVPSKDILNWQETHKFHLQRGVKYFKPIVSHQKQIKQTENFYKSVFLNSKEEGQKQENKKKFQQDKFEQKEKSNGKQGKNMYYKQKPKN